MLDKFETRLAFEMHEIVRPSSLQIVDANHMCAFADQTVDEVRTDEARAPRHKRNLLVPGLHFTLLRICPAGLRRGGFFDMLLQFGRPVGGGVCCEDSLACRLPNGGSVRAR